MAIEPTFVMIDSALAMLANARMIGIKKNAMILELIWPSDDFKSTRSRRENNEKCLEEDRRLKMRQRMRWWALGLFISNTNR